MSVEEEFWNWFVHNEDLLFHFEWDRERIFDQLSGAMQKVHPDLSFEFGPPGEKREFAISAGGLRRAFPVVLSLFNSAPKLERWTIIAFRPRRGLPELIEYAGKEVHSKDVQFSLLDNGRSTGIRLFIPGFQEKDVDWTQIGYLLLDEVLGEYDVEIKVGLIKMYSPEAATTERRYPLPELPEMFDRLICQLEGRSGIPS